MPLLFIAYFALGLIQLAAWIEGVEVAFGLGGFVTVIAVVVLVSLGFFGGVITSCFAFYGAWKTGYGTCLARPRSPSRS
jgi:hypothetical protein